SLPSKNCTSPSKSSRQTPSADPAHSNCPTANTSARSWSTRATRSRRCAVSEWKARRRAKRIRKLEDRLADHQHDLHKWGGFSYDPSEIRKVEEKIERDEQKLNALREEANDG